MGKAAHVGTWHVNEGVVGYTGPNGTQAPDMDVVSGPDRLLRVHH
ncbi:hypothetical protein [Streptacidiphilus jiangxiensis]|nr:hypothetical protein [Streptacidiphilus jiangxiensis]